MKKLFSHFLKREVSHVIRFSASPQHFKESVAEHSFYVAYFTAILCDLLERKKIKVNKEKAIKMALLHDLEEIFSGDILGPFKHYSENVYLEIQKVNKELIKEVFKDLPAELKREYILLWNEENERKSLEAEIVKIADKISLLSKCFEEIKSGNNYFKKIYQRELNKLRNSKYPWFKKIKSFLF